MSERKLPAPDVVLELVERGFSTYEVARQYGTSRQAVQGCLRRGGVKRAPNAPVVRLDLPWRVRAAHNMAPEMRRLRTLARMDARLPVSDSDRRAALNWARLLLNANRVVAYDRDAGFYLVPRLPHDEGLVRR